MRNKFRLFFSVILIFATFGCTSEPLPSLTNGLIYLDQTSVELPETAVLTVSAMSGGVTVRNLGESYLLFKLDDTQTADAFAYTTTCRGFLNVDDSCAIYFQFTPNSVGDFSRRFKIVNVASGDKAEVLLKGKSIANTYTPDAIPELSINTSSVTFPANAVGIRSAVKEVEIKNNTPDPIAFTFAFGGSGGSAYLMKSTCINNELIGALKTCRFSIAFTPSVKGSFSATLSIIKSATNIVNIPINATAVDAPTFMKQTGILDLTMSQDFINFYETDIDNKSNPRYINFQNDTPTAIELKYSIETNDVFSLRELGTTCFIDTVLNIITIPAASRCNLAVDFKPRQPIAYTDKINFRYLNRSFTIKLDGRGQNVSTAALFGYVSPVFFTTNPAPVFKNAIFFNNSPYAIKTTNITIKSFYADGTDMADADAAFSVDNASCENIIIGAYQSCVLTAGFYIDQTAGLVTPQAYRGEITVNTEFAVAGKVSLSGSTSTASTFAISSTDKEPYIEHVAPSLKVDLKIASATIGQKIYFYGGDFTDATTAKLLYCYDFSNNSIRQLNTAGRDIVRASGQKRAGYISSVNLVEYEGKLILYGGKLRMNYTGQPIDPAKPEDEIKYSAIQDDTVYIYDPDDREISQDGAWRSIKLNQGTVAPIMTIGAAVTIHNGLLYRYGGVDFAQNKVDSSNLFHTFDIEKGVWENITGKVTNLDASYENFVFPSATVINDVMYIYGGTEKVDTFTDYNLKMIALNIGTKNESSAGDIFTISAGGDLSSCTYKGIDTPVNEIGACRPYRLNMISNTSSIFTTNGMLDQTGGGIAGPWRFVPDFANKSGAWKNFQTTLGLSFSPFTILTMIDNTVAAFGGGKVYFFYLD